MSPDVFISPALGVTERRHQQTWKFLDLLPHRVPAGEPSCTERHRGSQQGLDAMNKEKRVPRETRETGVVGSRPLGPGRLGRSDKGAPAEDGPLLTSAAMVRERPWNR